MLFPVALGERVVLVLPVAFTLDFPVTAAAPVTEAAPVAELAGAEAAEAAGAPVYIIKCQYHPVHRK